MKALSDEELMVSYQKGEAAAFEELYRRYAPRVYGYLKGKVADGATRDERFQTIFLKLHQSREKYQAKFAFAPWLFTISRNVLIDASRSSQPLNRNWQPIDEETLAPNPPATQAAVTGTEFDLKQADRDLISLRTDEDLSFEAIAVRLGKKPAAIRQRWGRLMAKLRHQLNERGSR